MLKALLAVLCCISCLDQSRARDFQTCYNAQGQPDRCEPSIEPFSLNKAPSTNSTCGSPPANFCFRSVSLGEVSSDCTGVCDATDVENAHPPEFMTDFVQFQTWWQSENSPETQNPVMIDIPLGTKTQINLVSFRFQYFAPRNFRILKSMDYGATYTDFHYLSTSCISDYSIPSDQILSLSNETSVLCQSIDNPLYPGTITFFPLLGRPSTNDSTLGLSEALHRFITVTNIRVILVEHHNIPNLDSSDLGYYYALSDVSVLGRCQCNGHASECTSDYNCLCQHNTTGSRCERCSDFYQDVPWQISTGSEPFECIACNCNGHSNECRFDPEVYEQTNRTSGGVCLNCQNNRAGRQCERCADNFYPVDEAGTDIGFICTGCGCIPAGIVNNGTCVEGNLLGNCSCKENTVGRTCGTCAPGFFNLSASNEQGCQACECDVSGSLDSTCDPITGVCACKPNIIGDKCDQCRPAYYLQDPTSDAGCVPCNCNIGGSTSAQCDVTNGACNCREGVEGITCSEVERDRFFRGLDYLILEGEDAIGSPNPVIVVDGPNQMFTGTGFYGVEDGNSDSADFGSLIPPVNGLYQVVLRYNLQGSTFWNSMTLSVVAESNDQSDEPIVCAGGGPGDDIPEVTDLLNVNYTGWSMGIGVSIFRTFCLRGGRSYQFTLSDFMSGRNDDAAILHVDSLVLIPVRSSEVGVFENVATRMDYEECIDYYRSLMTQPSAPLSCERTIFTVSTAIYNGTAACDCNAMGTMMGSVCREFGGQCSCLPGVRGRQCDECSPGFHNLTRIGCTRCSCDGIGSISSLCDPVDGSCMCIDNVAGQDCSSCIPDYWGFNTPEGCARCSCDPTGSAVSQCNEFTGQCICRQGVTGESCDSCQNLTFGFSSEGCSMCGCDLAGSTEENCDVTTGQCSCLPTTTGRDCSQCAEGTFNLQTSNPNGCQPCFCSGLTSDCSPSSGFYYAMLSSLFSTSLEGWQPVDSITNLPILLVLGSPMLGEGIIVEANSNAYLNAPVVFIGNKLSSYSQFIQVTLDPLISSMSLESTLDYGIIISGSDITIGLNLTRTSAGFSAHLHESAGWVHLDSLTNPSVQEFQLVLSSLTSILISASYSTDINIYSITLDTAIQMLPDESDTPEVTFVESCACPENYTGFSCEVCSDGYTRASSGLCELCQCNGLSLDCDSITGDCLNCSRSATGRSCDACSEGTYGNPAAGIECLPCPCPLTSGPGQFSDTCVLLSSGSVSCLNCPPGHTGSQCESCISGYFGDPTGVPPTPCSDCRCSGNIDTADPNACDELTGLCTGCLFNTTGNQCERCLEGLYGDAVVAKNCTACDCDTYGSLDSLCDHMTGQCFCLSNVTGQRCDQCQPGYFGFGSSSGCTPCNCNALGSARDQCNELGVCECQPGVTGETCDQCLPGFFGLSESGCSACSCSPINSVPTMCDASDGTCICNPGSTGENCQFCIQNYFQTESGCTDCPKCYQDIEDLFNSLLLNYEDEETRVLNLTSTTSELTPVDQRLTQFRNEIGNLEEDASELVSRQSTLLVIYQELLSAINGTLRDRLVQINDSFDNLRPSFQTINLLAVTSQELMVNIQNEFNTATDFIRRIEMLNLPSIANLSNAVQLSATEVNITALEIEESLQNLSTQVDNLRNLTYMILSLSNSILDGAEGLSDLQAEIVEALRDILSSYASIEDQISDTAITVSLFEIEIMNITYRLLAKNNSLVTVPNADEINWLIRNATQTEDFVRNDLILEITIQRERFDELNQTYTASRIEFESLFSKIYNLEVNTSRLLELIRDSYREVSTLSANTQGLISEAEMIAENLESFSNDTFLIEEEVAAAMEEVERINANSNRTLESVRYLEESLRESGELVRVAKDVAFNASNITASSYQDLSSIDTNAVVASVNASLQSSIRDLAKLESLATNVTDNFLALQQQSSDIAQSEADVDEANSQNNQSSILRDSAVQAIAEFRAVLDNLEPVDQGRLDLLRQLVSDAREDFNMADLTEMYRELSSALTSQRDTRLQLEAELRSLDEDIEHLRRVNLALPSGCSEEGQ